MSERRFIRIGQAPAYLAMDGRTFRRLVRPYVTVINHMALGKCVDRVDLDAVADVIKQMRGVAPEHPIEHLVDELCLDRESSPVSSDGKTAAGISTSESEESAAFSAAVQRATSKKQTPGQSKSSPKRGPRTPRRQANA